MQIQTALITLVRPKLMSHRLILLKNDAVSFLWEGLCCVTVSPLYWIILLAPAETAQLHYKSRPSCLSQGKFEERCWRLTYSDVAVQPESQDTLSLWDPVEMLPGHVLQVSCSVEKEWITGYYMCFVTCALCWLVAVPCNVWLRCITQRCNVSFICGQV